MLTKGLDNVAGTAGNDTIIGSITAATGVTELDTLSTLDIVNGGAGIDTLKIATSIATAGTPNLPNLSNVEIIEVEATAGVTINTSAVAGVTNLNVLKQGTGLIDATAAATTDIAVTVKEDVSATTSLANAIKGGNNVTVTGTDLGNATPAQADAITVGGAGALAAAGNVVVNATGAKSVAATDKTLSAVTVIGGKTIAVTQKATSDAAAAATDKVGTTITQGAVTVTGNASTTTVAAKQDASVAEVLAVDAVAAKAATQDVTFAAMTAGQTVVVDFGAGALTFTANKALTAAEAASAFANLVAGAKQGNASAALGIYTDANADAAATTSTGVTNGWTSGAVTTVSTTAAKVTFTSATAATAITDAGGAVASVPGAYSGNAVAAVAAKAGVLGVTNGAVGVTDGANSIKTITVDGYANSTTTATTVLETLNLSNSGLTYSTVVGKVGQVTAAAGITVADTAATLALNLEKVGFSGYYNGEAAVTTQAGAVALTLAPTTLNVKSTGNNYVNLTADLTETLNVSGTGLLNASTADLLVLKTVKVTETAGLTLNTAVSNTVTSVDTTGTTGTVTVTIKGDTATYTGGAGVDNVSVDNASTAISKAIDLGAGNDRLDLSATLAIDPTVEIKGGDGIDTIVLSAQAAHDRSAASTFEGKITSFEKLSVGNVAGAASYTVNMTNVDDINYVISANTAAALVATPTNTVVTFSGLTVGQALTIGGLTLTAYSTVAASVVAGAFASLANGAAGTSPAGATFSGTFSSDWTSAAVVGNNVTFTNDATGVNAAITVVEGAVAQASALAAYQFTDGVDTTSPGKIDITFAALAVGQSYTLFGITVTAKTSQADTGVAAKMLAALDAADATLTTDANFLVTGTLDTAALTGWTLATFADRTAVVGAVLTITDNATLAKTDDPTIAVVTRSAAATAPTNLTEFATVGNATVGVGALVIDKLASNGTLELTAAGAGLEVKMTDATTGLTDVLNVVTSATTGANLGTVKAAGVETINITANDTDTTTTVNAITGAVTGNVSTNTLVLAADKAATIKVDGAGNLILTLDATATAVTLIDGTTATGKLDVTTLASDLAATTVKGGSAADVLTAKGANDVLIGGAGNDTLKVVGGIASAVTLTGGDGVDSFDVSGFTAANAGAAATITDLIKGETIKFVTSANANFASSKVALIAEATFDNYVTEAAKAADAASASDHGLAWFQFGGNTFVVQDVNGDAAFNNGTDIIVKLTGLVDLSASSFNEVGQGTLMYI